VKGRRRDGAVDTMPVGQKNVHIKAGVKRRASDSAGDGDDSPRSGGNSSAPSIPRDDGTGRAMEGTGVLPRAIPKRQRTGNTSRQVAVPFMACSLLVISHAVGLGLHLQDSNALTVVRRVGGDEKQDGDKEDVVDIVDDEDDEKVVPEDDDDVVINDGRSDPPPAPSSITKHLRLGSASARAPLPPQARESLGGREETTTVVSSQEGDCSISTKGVQLLLEL